ncbi:prolyl oligopeptidase family serine peptidase [Kribbella solani]|uniref:prolyl oligopeptidase family serine peptidase n=1 Tax=Kribbella solani TaxID=236067 RepID=UPI0029B42B0B|nr:prolyl oligopeptidase family serine peptidase [Kribbella solani]MDX2967688.1 prolyl oligopeptidase family serine peptidase [Kribbella solani]
MIDSVQSHPCAERLPLVEQMHGRTVADPYRRLEDPSAAGTQRWLQDQDDHWLTYAGTLTNRFGWKNAVRRLSSVGSVSAPVRRGGRSFTLRRAADQDHAVLYVDETPLLDPKQLDPTGLTTLDAWQPTPDGSKLAVQLSRGGDERSTLSVLDVATGLTIDGPIDGCRYSPIAWLPDGTSFYYVRFRQVRHHQLGVRDDSIVLDGEASYGLEISADGRWLTISAVRGAGNDLWLADLTTDAPPAYVPQDATTVMSVGPDDRLYVVTTQDSPTGRICVGDPAEPTVWHDYIQPSGPLTGLAVLDEVVLVGTLSEITVHDRETGLFRSAVELPGLGSVGSLSAAGDQAWFTYTDSVTPPTVCRYDARTGQTAYQGEVRATVETHRLTTSSGVELQIIGKPGPRPTILYGYGGFGQSLTPTYSAFALAWVEAGGTFVTAAVRGGGERGTASHQAGTRRNKQKVFDDFVEAAEHLVGTGWTTPDQLALCGESNGGLLVAAALTQRPELFAAAVCSAPLTDMVRYEQSGLGARWTAEYGSAQDPDDFNSLLSYSPYHQVTDGVQYPAVLLTSFGNDTRVDPLHARKFCAALQYATASHRPVLLRHEADAGHTTGGINLAADMLAFIADQTGLCT